MNTSTAPSNRTVRPTIRRGALTTLSARVRRVTPLSPGVVLCLLDTPAGPLRTFSDAAALHLEALQPGAAVRVVMLKLRRPHPRSFCHWQLLACGVEPATSQDSGVAAVTTGSAA